MKCALSNTCANKHLCCNFCEKKCDVKCRDPHENCSWFDNAPLIETLEPQDIQLFTYKKNALGKYTKRCITLAELVSKAKKTRGCRA